MKQVFEQVSRALLCAAICHASVGALATPMISDLKVTSVEPLGVAIDFRVSGATEVDSEMSLCATLSVGNSTIGALNLLGSTSCADGAHRVYWNMAAEGIEFTPTNASVTVSYLPHPTYCIINFSGGSMANAYPIIYMNAEPKDGFNTTEYKTTKIVLKRVDAGTFIMGDDQTNELHRVTLTKPFYMGLFEVTQKQWELVMGSNPCSSTLYGKGAAYPVHYVSYDGIRGSSTGAKWPTSNAVDADSFLGKLRARTGNLAFDLPTEAQWEYACRAGTTTTYSYGDSVDGAYMWYTSNSSSKSHEVGTKLPNKWGFYDMHGNVWEWCLDWYSSSLSYGTDPNGSSSGSLRVERGGSWDYYASGCTSSYRGGNCPLNSSTGYSCRGFRLSRALSSIADADAASVTVEFALGRICANGSSVDGKMSLGYAPSETRNAAVVINDEVLMNAGEAGSWTWTAQTAGVYAVSHTVGDDVMSASYVVTNGYAKVAEMPNPPMELVEGITLSPSGEASVVSGKSKQIIKISGNGEAWTGATSADWLKLNSIAGTATKSIVCTVAENVEAEGRVGYVYIAGQTLKVVQAGRGAMVDEQVVADTAGGEIEILISVTDEATTWSASSECPWIQVETPSGTGSGRVKLQVLPWNATTSRMGTVTVAGKTVTVTQNAAKFELEGALTRCCNRDGIDALIVTVRVDVAMLPWTVDISEDASEWVFLMSDEAAVTGDGTFELYVIPAEDGDTLPRTATVTVGNATLTIVQDDRVAIDDGYMSFFIPTSWFAQYPTLGGTTVAEWQAIAEGASGKTDASGAAVPVWHDYVAGTDPTNALSRFTAKIEMKDGAPVVTWSPALNGEGVREGARIYRVWGKANLDDAAWSEVEAGGEGDFRFFRVTVEMP